MEINAEINKVFGTEMARLFAGTIPEEELKKKAAEVWEQMNRVGFDYCSRRKDTEIERAIKNEILDRLYGKIREILQEPVAIEILDRKAREMVENARKVAEEAIIRDMAGHMTENVLSVYGRNEDIIRQVMAAMQLEANEGRF